MLRYLICVFIILVSDNSARAESPFHLLTDDWPPYEYKEIQSSEVTGLSTEIIRAVFKQLQWPQPTIEIYPWARAEQEAMSGKVDGIYSIVNNTERQQQLRYPDEPLAREHGVFFVRKDHPLASPINSFDDLRSLRIGVVRGYSYSQQLWTALQKFNNYIAVAEEKQLFQMLALDRFDAVVSYRNPGLSMLHRLGLDGQIQPYEGFELFTHSFYLAFNRDRRTHTQVADFSRKLTAFKTTQAYQQLLQRYLTPSDHRLEKNPPASTETANAQAQP